MSLVLDFFMSELHHQLDAVDFFNGVHQLMKEFIGYNISFQKIKEVEMTKFR